MKILIVVDMQNDFVTGVLGTKEAVAVVPKVKKRILNGMAQGEAVLFTRDTHEQNYLETQEGKKLPVPHCIRGTEGWEIVDALQGYAINTAPIDKPAFGSLDLCGILQIIDGQTSVEKITLVGLCTDICVISNAMLLKAALPEAEIAVDASCCAGVTPESHAIALAAMAACQISIENQS